MPSQNPLFIPGPTNMPDRIRHAMSVQTMDHRAPDFSEMFMPLLDDLKKVLKTKNAEVAIFPASGTGGWEAALTGTLSPGDKVLASRFGQFTDRWIDMCERLKFNPQVVECAWGEGTPAEEYRRALAADTNHEIKAVLVCHNETATGVRSDVAAVRKALDDTKHPALLLVDGVSSIASMDFRMDEWGVDVAITGSQKGFMLATGMAILLLSPKAMEAAKTAESPRCFLDIQEMVAKNRNGAFPYTPSLPLICGLRESLDMLLEEGIENVFARHYRIAEGVRRAIGAWGLEICARRPELYSDTVTAIYVPEGFDSTQLVNHAYKEYNVSFGVGLSKVAGKVFRIGHLGSMTDVMALAGIATAEMAMKDLGYPIELGSGTAAAQDYYRGTRENQHLKAA